MSIILDGTSGITNDATDLSYTGTLTGGTGVVNLGSGQLVKDAAGNLLVGTTTPRQFVTISQDASVGTGWEINNSNAGSNTTKVSGQYFSGADTVGTYKQTGSVVVGPSEDNYVASYMAFRTRKSDTVSEAMRINSSGNLLLGTTEGSALLTVGASSNTSAYVSIRGLGVSYPNAATFMGVGSNYIAFGWASPNILGSVDNAVSMVVGTASDYRLKTNIQPLTGSVKAIMALRPIAYNPISFDGTVNTEKQELGLIAHEVQAIRASVVIGEKDAVSEEGNPQYQSVNYAGLVPDLIAVVQEQQALIQSLTTRITALEAK